MSKDLLKTSLQLAQLDVIVRTSYVDNRLGRVHQEDVLDLKRLLSSVKPSLFVAKCCCVLNPQFGKASVLVGGADADLVLDDTLIEIKTTTYLHLQRVHFHQLLGYYVLSRIGGIDGFPPTRRLQALGVYYARFGQLYTFPIEGVIDERRLSVFIKWFKRRAQQKRGLLAL